jgi:hypothetical protein
MREAAKITMSAAIVCRAGPNEGGIGIPWTDFQGFELVTLGGASLALQFLPYVKGIGPKEQKTKPRLAREGDEAERELA